MNSQLSVSQKKTQKKYGKPVLVMAHRGISTHYPENTIVSFQKALDLGVEIVEFDVRRSATGELVVIHDPALERTTNGKGPVSDKTFDELRSLDAGSWKHARFAGERIPTLRETYECLGAQKDLILNVEIKDCEPLTARESAALAKEMNLFERCVFTCFDAEVLLLLKGPEIGAVTQGFPSHMMRHFPDHLFDTQNKFMDYVGVPATGASRELFDWYESRGIQHGVWCIDDGPRALEAARLGTCIITSNDPAVVMEALKTGGYR